MQNSVNTVVKNLNNSALVSWFVPNFESFGVLESDFEEVQINKPRITVTRATPIEEASTSEELDEEEEEISTTFGYTYEYDDYNHHIEAVKYCDIDEYGR